MFYDKAGQQDDYCTHNAAPSKAIPQLQLDKVKRRQEKKLKRDRTEERKMSNTGDDYNFKNLTQNLMVNDSVSQEILQSSDEFEVRSQ